MPTALRRLRAALVALATLAGLFTGASACEAMKAAGPCSASKAACACCAAPDEAEVKAPAEIPTRPEAAPMARPCGCAERPEVPAGPAPKPARLADEVRADRGGTLAVEIPDLRPAPPAGGPKATPAGRPPDVPIFLRDSRLLI